MTASIRWRACAADARARRAAAQSRVRFRPRASGSHSYRAWASRACSSDGSTVTRRSTPLFSCARTAAARIAWPSRKSRLPANAPQRTEKGRKRGSTMGTSWKVMLLAVLLWSTVSWCGGTALEVNAAEEATAAAVAVAANDFGFRLLHALNANGTATNLIVSPLSVSQALTMTYNGARGNTKTAMARTLGIGAIDVSQLNA